MNINSQKQIPWAHGQPSYHLVCEVFLICTTEFSLEFCTVQKTFHLPFVTDWRQEVTIVLRKLWQVTRIQILNVPFFVASILDRGVRRSGVSPYGLKTCHQLQYLEPKQQIGQSSKLVSSAVFFVLHIWEKQIF